MAADDPEESSALEARPHCLEAALTIAGATPNAQRIVTKIVRIWKSAATSSGDWGTLRSLAPALQRWFRPAVRNSDFAYRVPGEQRVDVWRARVQSIWSLPTLHAEVLVSQVLRVLVDSALRLGRRTAWGYQPRFDAREQNVCNDKTLDELEAAARFPRPALS